MRIKKYVTVNCLLGILTALMVSMLIFSQGNLIISYLYHKEYDVNVRNINILCGTIAIVAFVLIMKAFLSIHRKRLTMYFILSIVISIVVVYAMIYVLLSIFGMLVSYQDFQQFLSSNVGELVTLTAGYIIIIVPVAIFVCSFMILVNRKVKYIQYISEEIKKIEMNGFGRTMEVRGNDELSDLSKGINAMSVKLQEKFELEKQMERNKNELITNVSHDLRTPLTSIMGYVTLLKENGFKEKDKFDEYIDVVDRRVKGLNTLINELFEYTKLSSNELRLDFMEIDIIPMLEHLLKEYTIIFHKEELQMEYHIALDQCYLEIDVNKMIRVLQNMLDNAKKYAVKKSTVKVSVNQIENRLCIKIKNKTAQLQRENMNQIFERFYKVDKARSEAESSGLGLAIVKRIVELHGGTIEAELESDVVSFHIQLPIHRNK